MVRRLIERCPAHRAGVVVAVAVTVLFSALTGRVEAAAVCARRPPVQPAMERLRTALAAGRFVTYQPTSLRVIDGHASEASAESIRADLVALRPHFDALVTYGARHGAEAIPRVAATLGYRALVIGVWDPFDDAEVAAALAAAAAEPDLVVGLVVGNEWRFAARPRAAELTGRLVAIRERARSLPLASSEPFHLFDNDGAAEELAELDFLAPIVHPVFQPWFRDAPSANAAEFVVSVTARLARRFCGPILVKETGVPTAPESAGFGEARQAEFYRELARRFPAARERAFAYFDAFDAPWRVADEQASPGYHPEEAHWGLFDEARRPKAAVRALPPLAPR